MKTLSAVLLLVALASPAIGQGSVTPNLPGVAPPVPAPTPMPIPPSSAVNPPSPLTTVPRIRNNNSFSDRVQNCLHSAPLEAGRGNNPRNRDAYVRSCAN